MSSIKDGLGWEELAISGMQISGTGYMNPYFLGSLTTTSNISGGGTVFGTNISGASMRVTTLTAVTSLSGTGVFGTTISGLAIVNRSGLIQSVAIENATQLFGYRVVAGSVLFGNSNSGLIAFPSAGSFSTANYYMTLSAQDWTVPLTTTTGSSTALFISGTRRASGCWACGPSGTVAEWIAVGI